MKVFEVASFHDLSFERENISKEVEHNNVALIRGMLDPNLIRESLAKFMKSVRDSEILGTTQGVVSWLEEIHSNGLLGHQPVRK